MQIQNAILTGSTTVYGPITFVSGTLAGSASYAATSSYADTFTVAGSLTAQTLVVQTITSSIDYVTGSTRFGSLLTNTHTFTGSLQVTGSTISLSNSKVIIGDDGTYGGNISTIGFGGTSNGFNRIAAANNTSDGLYLIAATGRGIYLRPGGKSTQDLSVFPNGNTALGVNFLLPTATLHISGSGSGSLMQISSTVSSSIFFVSGSGNVGIGTTTPAFPLEVSSSSTTLLARFTSNQANAAIRIVNSSANLGRTYSIGSGDTTSAAGNNFYIYDETGGAARFVISGSGNVGIGTTSPVQKLHVEGSTAIGTTGTEDILILGRALSGGVSFQQAASLKLGRYQNAGGAYESYTRLDFALRDNSAASNYNTNTTVMTLTNAGYVGINNTNPGARLIINGGGSSETSFQLNDGSSRRVFCIPSQYYGYIFAVSVASDGGKAISIGNGGGASEVGSIVANNASTTYNTTSDYRLKEDLKSFNGLEKISAIKVYDFKWKTNEERTHGVLAHELNEVLPYAVHGEKDGLDRDGNPSYQGVDYSKIVPSLVKSIQELSTKLEEATTRIKTLESK